MKMAEGEGHSIKDVDIRENTATKLRFRKMPWHEIIGFGVLFSLALVCLALRATLPDEKEWKLRAFLYLAGAIVLGGLSMLFFFEGRMESIELNKETNRFSIKRHYLVPCYFPKLTYHPLAHIIRVHAARRGSLKDGMDNTVYVLIVSMIRGSEIKILETRNATKIRKELICIRKFLGMDDADVLTIYDETRKPGENKKKV